VVVTRKCGGVQFRARLALARVGWAEDQAQAGEKTQRRERNVCDRIGSNLHGFIVQV